MKNDSAENTAAYTREYLTDEYEKINVKYRREKVLEFLNNNKAKRILEIGCGTQSLFEFYKSFEQFTVVEPSSEFCAIVKKSPAFNENVHVINGFFGSDSVNSQLIGGGYDCIVISSLIHEVPDPELILRTACAFCNEDTFVHINVPNEDSFHLLWALEAGLIQRLDNISETGKRLQRSRTFNLTKLKEIVERNGFKVTEQGSYAFKLFNQAKIVKMMKEEFIDNNLLDSLQRMTKYFPNNGAEIFVNCILDKNLEI